MLSCRAQVGIFCSTPGVALVRAIPSKIAADMLFTGDTITAQQALSFGLVSRVVPQKALGEKNYNHIFRFAVLIVM